MARKSKAQKEQIAREQAADRKRRSRANLKEKDLVILNLEVEMPTLTAIQRLAAHLGKTNSQVVQEMMDGVRLPERAPKFTTRGYNARSIELTLPASVKDTLMTHRLISGGGAIEWLFLERCSLLPLGGAGTLDDLGTEFELWEEERSLVYHHPVGNEMGDGIYVRTGMPHFPAGLRRGGDPDVDGSGRPYDKYTDRRMLVLQAKNDTTRNKLSNDRSEDAMVRRVEENADFQEAMRSLAARPSPDGTYDGYDRSRHQRSATVDGVPRDEIEANLNWYYSNQGD